MTSTFLGKKDFIINIGSLKNNSFEILIEKIEEGAVELKSISQVKAGLQAYEVGTGVPVQTKEMKDQRIYHSKIKVDESYLTYLEGKDVNKYFYLWSGDYLKYGDNLASPRKNFDLFSTERILVRQIPSKPPYCINACLLNDTILNDRNSMNIIYLQQNSKYVLSILNSKLISFWFIHKFGKMQRGIFPQFKVNELEIFPIRIIDLKKQQPFIIIADKILNAKKDNPQIDTSHLEKEVDIRVYHLYNLSFAEANLIDESLTEIEFNKYVK